MKIDFVIPVYNERETLRPLVEGILAQAGEHEFHIILIDDGSTDGSREKEQEISSAYSEVETVWLRGNFGKSIALAVGFSVCTGDFVFTMDADLQDDPREIPRFIQKSGEGYDVVCGWKKERHDPWHKTIPSHIYNAIVAALFKLPVHDVNCGFKLYRTEVVKHFRLWGEMHRLLPVQAQMAGFTITEIPVEHHKRRYGVSKYGIERFSRGALDVCTMWFLSHFRHRPAHFFGKLGLATGFAGFLFLLLSLGLVLGGGRILTAFASLLLGCMLILGNFFFISLGLFAEFILYHLHHVAPGDYIEDR